jgi:hypothetical protein
MLHMKCFMLAFYSVLLVLSPASAVEHTTQVRVQDARKETKLLFSCSAPRTSCNRLLMIVVCLHAIGLLSQCCPSRGMCPVAVRSYSSASSAGPSLGIQ